MATYSRNAAIAAQQAARRKAAQAAAQARINAGAPPKPTLLDDINDRSLVGGDIAPGQLLPQPARPPPAQTGPNLDDLPGRGPTLTPPPGRRDPPAPPPTNLQDDIVKRARDLLGSQQDTSAARAAAEARLKQQGEKAILDNRARMGAAGFGLSGAAQSVEGDLQRQSAIDRELALQDFDTKARSQSLNELKGIQNIGLTQEGFDLGQVQAEEDVGLDLNDDGLVGNTPVDQFQKEDQANRDQLNTIAIGQLLGQLNPPVNNIDGIGFREITSGTRSRLEALGAKLTPVRGINKPFGWDMSGEPFSPLQDQYGNYYLIRRKVG